MLDRQSCLRALDAHDARFDGVFFVGITSTGIYCRPVCPARPARRDRCRFFASAALAEQAGFRPCLRCRPELAPGRARVDAVPRTAEAGARRIASGALNGRSVEELAAELGVSGRHLRRAVQRELGVTPIALAQTHRLLLAKRLLTDTGLPVTRVAFASGFQSVRRMNALFRARYRINPAALRRTAPGPGPEPAGTEDRIRLSLACRPPFGFDALLAFLAPRATPGVEVVTGGSYARAVRLGDGVGFVRVSRPGPERRGRSAAAALAVEVSAALVLDLMPLLGRLRHLFDLDAEPGTIAAHLGAVGLGALVRRAPGLRVPGAFDGFELAVRAVLGQQVSVKAATTFAGRLAARFGEPVTTGHLALTRLAPTPERLVDAGVPGIMGCGLTRARAESVVALARTVAAGDLRLDPETAADETTERLMELPGIGPWTAQYITMRALRWPDAFPAGDLCLRRATGQPTAAALGRLAEPWRPWRAYAAMHLWAAGPRAAPLLGPAGRRAS